jgi:hypothetical protein
VISDAQRAGISGLSATAQSRGVEFRVTVKNGLPRDLNMTNKERKHEKAIKKIETAVKKAIGKGVSKKAIEDTVELAIVQATEIVPGKKMAVHKTLAKKSLAKKVVPKKTPAKKAITKKGPRKKASAKKVSSEEAVAKVVNAEETVATTI